jgi:hypothetical protein
MPLYQKQKEMEKQAISFSISIYFKLWLSNIRNQQELETGIVQMGEKTFNQLKARQLVQRWRKATHQKHFSYINAKSIHIMRRKRQFYAMWKFKLILQNPNLGIESLPKAKILSKRDLELFDSSDHDFRRAKSHLVASYQSKYFKRWTDSCSRNKCRNRLAIQICSLKLRKFLTHWRMKQSQMRHRVTMVDERYANRVQVAFFHRWCSAARRTRIQQRREMYCSLLKQWIAKLEFGNCDVQVLVSKHPERYIRKHNHFLLWKTVFKKVRSYR